MVTALTKGAKAEAAELRKFNARIYRGEQWYVAECVELGIVSQGKTVPTAISNLIDAIEGYLEGFPSAAHETVVEEEDLVAGVHELEDLYSEMIGEPVDPSPIQLVQTTTFTVPGVYA